jgi:voltage-gated potassium channel
VLCRRLRPEAQILVRISAEKNVQTAMRAGADVVLSYAAMGAACVLDRLRGDHELVVSQGLHLARVPVPAGDAGRRLDQARGVKARGWQVLAILAGDGAHITPVADTVLTSECELLVAVSDGMDRVAEPVIESSDFVAG